MDYIWQVVIEFWRLSEEMAPYLLLGFLVAALLRSFVDDRFVQRHLGARGWRQTAKAALIGVPLPLCSCGVIPVAASLRRQGGSAGAVVSFTASTPQTGVDSIFATGALLSWPFAFVRVLVAFINGIAAGTLVDRFGGRAAHAGATREEAASCCSSQSAPVPEAAESCCGSGTVARVAGVTTEQHARAGEAFPAAASGSSCCGGGDEGRPEDARATGTTTVIEEREEKHECGCGGGKTPAQADAASGGTGCCSGESTSTARGRKGRFAEGFRFGLLTLPADIGGALLFGLFLAALLTVFLPSDLGSSTWTQGILAYAATTLVAVPLYVCSTGSIPMAYALIHAGFSPGAALVFLIAGPATNTATVSALWKMTGTRAVVIYLATLVGVAWLAGWIIDEIGMEMTLAGAHAHVEGTALWKTVSAVVLFLLLAVAFLKPLWPRSQKA